MKTTAVVIGAMMASVLVSRGQTVTWRSSTDSERWADRGTIDVAPHSDVNGLRIDIDRNTRYQEIDGFGGAFNELGWDALSALDEAERDDVMRELFDPESGCGFNLCRMPMGASDFAMDYYSLNDHAGDYAMEHFSIERDRQRLIPYIKAAMEHNPELKVWGSPWTPPAWMKTNNHYSGGWWHTDAQTLSAYALYFAKATRAYQAEGLDFYAVHVQNEPEVENVYPTSRVSGATLRDFIRDHLGPRFENDGIDAEIWLGTISRNWYDEYISTVLGDASASAYITGVGYQYDGLHIIGRTHNEYPSKRLMQTETVCGSHENDWNYAQYTFFRMQQYFEGWANSYMQWNIVLDQTGRSSWGWAQNSMVSVDKNTKSVTYNPQHYCAKHFSHFLKRGAYRIATSGDYGDKIAFENPDGNIVVVVMNSGGADLSVTIRFEEGSIRPVVPAHSFNTFTTTYPVNARRKAVVRSSRTAGIRPGPNSPPAFVCDVAGRRRTCISGAGLDRLPAGVYLAAYEVGAATRVRRLVVGR
jgi:glucosylceramidase